MPNQTKSILLTDLTLQFRDQPFVNCLYQKCKIPYSSEIKIFLWRRSQFWCKPNYGSYDLSYAKDKGLIFYFIRYESSVINLITYNQLAFKHLIKTWNNRVYPIKREPLLTLSFVSSNPFNYRSPPVFDLIFNKMPYVNGFENYQQTIKSNYPSVSENHASLSHIKSRHEKFEHIKTQRDAFFRSKIEFCSKMALYDQIERDERLPFMGPSRNNVRYCYDNILFNLEDKIKDTNEKSCLSDFNTYCKMNSRGEKTCSTNSCR